MVLRRIALATLLYVGTFTCSHADLLGLNINGNSVEAEYSMGLDKQLGYAEGSHYSAFVRYLHRDGTLIHVGFTLSGRLENADSFEFGGGLEGVFGDSYGAVPLFVQASYILPLNDPLPLTTVSARLAYAPSVLTFIDANRYKAFRCEVDSQIVPRFHLYAGYRTIDTDYETRNQTFDDSWYGGIRFYF